jgi:hypothetical protein
MSTRRTSSTTAAGAVGRQPVLRCSEVGSKRLFLEDVGDTAGEVATGGCGGAALPVAADELGFQLTEVAGDGPVEVSGSARK